MRILALVHNHPDLQPGGTEVVARGLFRAMRDGGTGVDGLFLAAVTEHLREERPGTLLQAAPGGRPDEALLWLPHFDRFFLSQPDTHGLAMTLGPLVTDLRPDIVHLHHPLQFGVETMALLRRLMPRGARLVVTLHDYFALCAREGQLLRTDGRLCAGPSPDACRRCLPERSAADHALRRLSLRDAFADADALIAPSIFLRDRFVAAGWDASRITVLPNAVAGGSPPAPHRPLGEGAGAQSGRRDRFAFLGHINRFKGPLVALAASARLSAAGVAHALSLHGGTAYQPDAFLAEFRAALAAAPAARHHGTYDAAELPRRIAAADWVVVPSIWYENAPLVVLEAFRHRRPVICGDAGGMAELVRDGVDGLHAPIGDPEGWAEVMARAASEPGLWDRLVAGIRPPPGLDDMAAAHLDFYRRLLRRSSSRARAPAAAVA
ncbi:glycosyltransferase [Roseomonas sp. CCTCC AB2023176]|uniref:glycosyltransferase n=1 Tax=Roseomonas sp. CCTCC AB2023176 TaxID=3342640 RepID=UPI0035E3332D